MLTLRWSSVIECWSFWDGGGRSNDNYKNNGLSSGPKCVGKSLLHFMRWRPGAGRTQNAGVVGAKGIDFACRRSACCFETQVVKHDGVFIIFRLRL